LACHFLRRASSAIQLIHYYTPPEELEGWQIIKAIACAEIDPGRIFHRDTKSYMNIILDDNIRKPIARLYFNRKKKFVGVYDENRIETKHPIEELNGIYAFSDQIRRTVGHYRS